MNKLYYLIGFHCVNIILQKKNYLECEFVYREMLSHIFSSTSCREIPTKTRHRAANPMETSGPHVARLSQNQNELG